MKLPSIAAVMLLVIGTGCSTLTKPPKEQGAPPAPPTVTTLDSMAVALVDEEENITCSGTWVGPGLVLTAAHCIKGGGTDSDYGEVFWVRSNPGELPLPGLRLKYDEKLDLGLLYVVGEKWSAPHGAAVLGPLPAVGDNLVALNNTFRMENSFMRGYVGGYQTIESDPDQRFMEVMLPGSYGASGSGIFDMQGRLVGVASWKWGGWDGVLFYVTADDIAAFLQGE